MFPRSRHHNPGWWFPRDRRGVQVVAKALARLLAAESRHGEWRETGWQRNRPRTPSRWREPRRFDGQPPRSHPRRMPAPGPWLPYRDGTPRPRVEWQRQPPGQGPQHWRGSMRPRRDAPVAAIRVPRWNQAEWGTRRPRGFEPRGPLLGGPERPADDPQRKPRGGLCGGPGRSANDTQTPHKTTSQRSTGTRMRKGANDKTHCCHRGQRRASPNMGPLSRRSAWRAGRFWDDLDGKVKVFLVKDGRREEVGVELRIQGARQSFWFVEMKPQPSQQPEGRGTRTNPSPWRRSSNPTRKTWSPNRPRMMSQS